MLKSAGYYTAVAGKWQLDGGDASIRAFGFDNYMVFNPFTGQQGEGDGGSRYKNPVIYYNGAIMDAGLTLGKYGDDMFLDYITAFMTSAANLILFIIQ